MAEKRFKLHITWLNNDYEEGEAELKDRNQPIALFDSVEDARMVRDLLNELNDENKTFREALKELKEIGDYQALQIKELDDENQKLQKDNEQLKIDLGIAEDNHKLDKEIIDDIHNEYQRIKEENEELKQLLDEAEDIIICQCTPHYQRQWENIKKNLKR